MRTRHAWFGLCVLAWAGSAHALFYDDFPNGPSVKPVDELEERIWQEAEVSRTQFVRGASSPSAQSLAVHSRKLLRKHWPDLDGKIHIDVVDNSDVFAFSSANGDVILSTGLFMRLDNEEEITSVLAREIGHVMKRHAVRTVYAARLGAGANTVFQAAVNASSFVSTVSVLSSFQVLPEMLVADGGKALLQSQLSRIRDAMADNFLRRMSATGFEAMVKTSLFGYSESLESESDEYALQQLDRIYGNTEAYKRVMQRLADEAGADEKKFSAFYANEVRMKARLDNQAAFDQKKQNRDSVPAVTPVAVDAPESQAAVVAEVSSGSIVIEDTGVVKAVVVGELGSEASEGEQPLDSVLGREPETYADLVGAISLAVCEAEMEAGHLARVVRNLERSRDGVRMPDQIQLVLAESLWSMPDQTLIAKGETLAFKYVQHHTQDARGLKLLGLIYLRKGEATKAEEFLQMALDAASNEDEKGFIEQYLHQAQKKKAQAAQQS